MSWELSEAESNLLCLKKQTIEDGRGGENHASSSITLPKMRFTKRISSLFLQQATKLPTRSLLGNPSLCRSYYNVGAPISTSLISSRSGGDAAVTGLTYHIRCRFIGYTAEQFSDDEYECEFEEHKVRVCFVSSW